MPLTLFSKFSGRDKIIILDVYSIIFFVFAFSNASIFLPLYKYIIEIYNIEQITAPRIMPNIKPSDLFKEPIKLYFTIPDIKCDII